MFTPASRLSIDENQRKGLQFLIRSGKTPQKIALRARIILAAAEGAPNNAIASQLQTSRPTVLLWRERFTRLGVPGIMKDAKRPGRKKQISEELVQQVVEKTLHSTPGGQTHWSTRTMAKEVGVSHDTIHRIWKQHRLAPHRVETFKLSKDPKFVEKCGMSSRCTSIRPRKPWCSRLTRRARSRPWSEPGRCCRWARGYQRGRATITTAMERRPCSRR